MTVCDPPPVKKPTPRAQRSGLIRTVKAKTHKVLRFERIRLDCVEPNSTVWQLNMSDPTEDLDTMQRDASRLRQDPVIRRLLRRMPKAVALSFNADQLYYLRKAIYKTSDKDGLEYRVFIPFLSRSLFVRIVYGINRRKTERSPTTLATKVGTVLFYLLAISVVLVCLYLIKSFMGIDLFHSFSMEVI